MSNSQMEAVERWADENGARGCAIEPAVTVLPETPDTPAAWFAAKFPGLCE